MTNERDRSAAADRLKLALEMHDFGVAIMRENLKRRHPDADQEKIDRLLSDWLHDLADVQVGDAERKAKVFSDDRLERPA